MNQQQEGNENEAEKSTYTRRWREGREREIKGERML